MDTQTNNSGVQLIIDVGMATDSGVARQSNEDSLLVLDLAQATSLIDRPLALLILADGMGGYEGGEIASTLASKVVGENVSRFLSSLRDTSTPDSRVVSTVLVDAVLKAGDEVLRESSIRRNGMGTTIVAVLIIGSKAYVVNVGDSRAYLLRGDRLSQVTADHSLVAALVSAGLITADEAYTHPQRNAITRCLGSQAKVLVDDFVVDLRAGDCVLLCSDGLWEMVRDNQIKEVLLEAPDTKTACHELASMANRNGGEDNISVIVARLREEVANATGSYPTKRGGAVPPAA